MEPIYRAKEFAAKALRSRPYWEETMGYAVEKVREDIPQFEGGYPGPASINLIYPKIPNNAWTCSFWTGMLYLAYEHTKDRRFLEAAGKTLPDWEHRLDARVKTANHDLGFLYILSAKADWMLTGNSEGRRIALKAAAMLMERYLPQAHILQAWGEIGKDSENDGRIIIDCLMNLPLLFWASQETGDIRYRDAALHHLEASRYLVRDDDTSFHTYYFDEKGKPLRGRTHQGYSDDSCWARGQAWGIYGFCLNYRYTRDMSMLVLAKRLANYFLNHLPDDLVPYWDLVFVKGNDQERDSSAAAIAACGLFLLSSLLPVLDSDRQVYENAALAMLGALDDRYSTRGLKSNGILMHATQAKPQGKGIDECNIYGDYFFMEALDALLHRHPLFW